MRNVLKKKMFIFREHFFRVFINREKQSLRKSKRKTVHLPIDRKEKTTGRGKSSKKNTEQLFLIPI